VEDAKAERVLLLLLFFFSNIMQTPEHVSATNVFEKVVTGGGSINSGSRADPPSAGGQRGFGCGASKASEIFQLFP